MQPKTGRPFWPTLALACAMSICVCSCGSQTAQKRPIQVSDSTAVLEVDDPRPLMAAAEAIEEEYGIQINYEDPPFRFAGDARDVTEQVSRSPGKGRVLVPRGGPVYLSFRVKRSGHGTYVPVDAEAVLKALIQEHQDRGHPGRFRVIRSAHGFDVIPTQVADSTGALVSIQPVLDETISFPEQERPLGETVKLIADLVSQSSGVRVRTCGLLSLKQTPRARLGATQMSAREALRSALDLSGERLGWHLLYDHGPRGQQYCLNLRRVILRKVDLLTGSDKWVPVPEN